MAENLDAILSDYARNMSPLLGNDEVDIKNTLLSRKKEINDFLEFYSYPDNLVASGEEDIKQIYELYQSVVNELLAQLEVNIHDLDKEVLSIISDLNRMVSLLRRTEVNSYHFKNAKNIIFILIHILQVKLIESYIYKIKQYRKFLRSFNQKGVLLESEGKKSFYEYTKAEFKDLKKSFKIWCGANKKEYKLDYNTKEYFDTKREIGLSPILEQAKNLALLYETYYPKIIGNGYGASIVTKIINVLLIVVPVSVLGVSIYLTLRGLK